jgi:hypothetical protein
VNEDLYERIFRESMNDSTKDDKPSAAILNEVGGHLREIRTLITKFGNQKYKEGQSSAKGE